MGLRFFLVRKDLEAVPFDRVLEPIFLEDPAQLLGHAGNLDRLAATVQVELDLVRDREDHPHEPLAVVPLGLPVVPQIPKVLLDQDVDALHVLLFFQAEDGIRHLTGTGVQTCALPIWAQRSTRRSGRSAGSTTPMKSPSGTRSPAGRGAPPRCGSPRSPPPSRGSGWTRPSSRPIR